jgi:hypothetical protein
MTTMKWMMIAMNNILLNNFVLTSRIAEIRKEHMREWPTTYHILFEEEISKKDLICEWCRMEI